MKLTEIGLAVGLTLGVAFNANPAPITIDFEDQTPGVYAELVINGFLFRAGSRMEVQPASEFLGFSRWLGFDAASHIGCIDPARAGIPSTASDLTPCATVTVSNGSLFTLLSVDPLSAEGAGGARWTLTSSKGGSYTNFFGAPSTVTFSDPAYWADVEWIMFYEPRSAGSSYGFDNLRLDFANARQLPEPGTLALLALALPGVLWLRRRK